MPGLPVVRVRRIEIIRIRPRWRRQLSGSSPRRLANHSMPRPLAWCRSRRSNGEGELHRQAGKRRLRRPCRRLDVSCGPRRLPLFIVSEAQGSAAVRAHWVLVPPGTIADARRSIAVRLTGVSAKGPSQAPVEALWSSTARSWRCIVPATGWIADVQGQATACKPPGQRVAARWCVQPVRECQRENRPHL